MSKKGFNAEEQAIYQKWVSQNPQTKPETTSDTTGTTFRKPQSDAEAAWQERQGQGNTPKRYTLPTPQAQTQVLPPASAWDYKTAKANPQGEALMTKQLGNWKLTPHGFDPNGQPYFGMGVENWLKKMAYTIIEDGQNSRNTIDQANARIKAGQEKISNAYKAQILKDNPDANAAQVLGYQAGNVASGLWDTIAGTWDLYEADNSGGVKSVLSPFLKSTRIVVEAGFDALQGVADTAERVIGMNKTIREYVKENGSPAPNVFKEMDFDPIKVSEKYAIQDELLLTFSRGLNPVLAAHDAIRFFMAPGTLNQKLDVLQTGWTENKILYSELVSPAIEAQYRLRLKAGEDPGLLLTELQDPWAEMIGEMAFDPLNLVDMVGKSIKQVKTLEDVKRRVDVAEGLMDVGFVEKLNEAQNLTTAAQGSAHLDDVAKTLVNFSYTTDGVSKIIQKQSYNLTALNSRGMQNLITRRSTNFFGQGLANIRAEGKPLENFFEWLTGTLKVTSNDIDEVKDGLATLQHYPNPMMAFSQDGMEASHLIRNIMKDGDVEEFITKLQKKGNDWPAIVKMLDDKINDATRYAYPSINEMADAAREVNIEQIDKYNDLTKQVDALKVELDQAWTQKAKGGVKDLKAKIAELNKAKALLPSDKKVALASQYVDLAKTRPGIVKVAELDRAVAKLVHPINSFFAGIYFSLSYGFAFRNAITNTVHVFADAGLGAYVKAEEGIPKWLTMKKIDQDLLEWFGGEMPVSLRMETMGSSMTPETGGILKEAMSKLDSMKYSPKHLAVQAEIGAGKRVFYKFYRDTMDNMLKAGVGLPPMDTWLKEGFSQSMMQDYVDLVKAKKYNVTEATKLLQSKYEKGVELWRQLDTIDPQVRAALSDNNSGVMDAIVNFVNDPKNNSLDQVKNFFNNAREEAVRAANMTVDDVIGVPKGSPQAEYIGNIEQKWGEQLNAGELTEMMVVQNKAINAKQKFMDAIGQAQKKLSDELRKFNLAGNTTEVDKISRRLQELSSFSNTTAISTLDDAARKATLDNNSRWFDDIKPQVEDRNWRKVWEQNVDFLGPIPPGADKNTFFKMGNYKRGEMNSVIWDRHFEEWFAHAQKLADNLGKDFAPLFESAKKANLDLQVMRKNVFTDGKIFRTPPTFLAAEVGTTQHGNNIAKLANYYNISSIGDAGLAKKDNFILNIVNKFMRETDVPLPELNKALSPFQALMDGKKTAGVTPEEFKLIFGDKWTDAKKGIPVGFINTSGLKDTYDTTGKALTSLDRVAKTLEETKLLPPNSSHDDVIALFRKWYQDPKGMQAAQDIEYQAAKAASDKAWEGFSSMDDVPFGVAEDAFKKFTGLDGKLEDLVPKVSLSDTAGSLEIDKSLPYMDEVTGEIVYPEPEKLLPAAPDYIDGSTPSMGRMAQETLEQKIEALNHVQMEIEKKWGQKSADTLSSSQIETMQKFAKEMGDKVSQAKYTASLVAEKARDFSLLPYGQTTNLDHALSYIYPYQFWYSRSYANWFKRIGTNSTLLANYGRWKDTMANIHRDQPEWWKYNVSFPDFLGINQGNPMMLNLEATIWPLNGITGTDFQDATKRTNWFTAMVDDMGKSGPSIWTPINMAIAGYYAVKGEKDIAAKWGGRLMSQTASIKAISSYFGTPIELDPNVQLFSGKGLGDFRAADPYEEGRISRALAAMASEGVPEEQLIEAARTHSGPLWDEAYQRATNLRAPGQLMSSFMGVGFKARTPDDMKTDQFYADYSRMRTLHEGGLMSDEKYKQGFNELRQKYPFMDVILLSRRAGMGRDAAYAYNVISRIPPGQSSEIYKIVGIDPETAQKFYDGGGKFGTMSETEKQRFMAGMVDAGARLLIPKNTTRQEWTDVKNMYSAMQKEIDKQYGTNIGEKISTYYGIDDVKKARLYLATNPDVAEAMDIKTAYIANNPMLLKYYGGVDTLERYYTGIMYDELDKKYPNATDLMTQYDSLYLDPKSQKAFLKEHPELKAFKDDRTQGYEDVLRQVLKFGYNLPQVELQKQTTTPENPVQKNIDKYVTPEPSISFDQWTEALGPNMTELVIDYYSTGEKMPYAAMQKLGKMAGQYGYKDEYAMLQSIMLSIPR